MYRAQLFEDTQAIGIMLVLLKEGRIFTTELSSRLAKGAGTTISRVRSLVAEDLIMEERETEFPRRKFLELTPKGRAVAEKLAEIEEILNGGGE
ncbi:MAG: winged helix-turn-helix transcriptional regulator [Methanomassiliicoccaceae archaeon]|jgi:DNA-binding MarR family transcriptional regulator|nr:winged helix-turn-helix transcriptional regulator [Euryarchaeota archaeon]HOB38786.1 MarR family winged helix-turn-helix transcriptional regulator [Methanomassiliicoccaceae archaeon]